MKNRPYRLSPPWPAVEAWWHRLTESSPAPAGRPRIGLVLSCGGARGLAHVGVIQVLEEAGIRIDAVIGSSMGAYVGSLWSAGLDGSALAGLAAEIKDRRTLLRLLDPALPPTKGFLRGEKIRRHLERTLGDTTIHQLRRETLIVATDLDSVAAEVLPGTTSVAAAVHASCAIPGICAPVALNGKRYVDGGASQPLPVKLLRTRASVDHVIAVNVMPSAEDIGSGRLNTFPSPPQRPETVLGRAWDAVMNQVNLFAYGNVLDTFKRCLTSAQLRLTAEESAGADVLIHPFFCESKWYDFENFTAYIDAGRRATEAALPRIRALLNPRSEEALPHENPSLHATLGQRPA